MHRLALNRALTPEMLALAVGSDELQRAWTVPDKARTGPAQ